jgi:hypothetical protein
MMPEYHPNYYRYFVTSLANVESLNQFNNLSELPFCDSKLHLRY